jgi:hypothetical protein
VKGNLFIRTHLFTLIFWLVIPAIGFAQDCDPDKDNYLTEGDICGGDDCAPLHPGINPGAYDKPNDGIDQNCDGVDALDLDGDGHVSIATGGDDCDDSDAGRYPGNAEVCDATNRDEDCDMATFGPLDQDGDGYIATRCCNGSNCGTDCNDTLRSVNPGNPDVCNGIDDNCDGAIDDDSESGDVTTLAFLDLDRDGWGDSGDAGIRLCPDQLLTELRSGVKGDCNDQAATINPGAAEACNGLDDNCNGIEDEGLSGACD